MERNYGSGICKICGKQFEKRMHNQFYCSDDCRYAAEKARDKNHTENKDGVVYDKKCTTCGKNFKTTKYNEHFCSADCRAKYRKIRLTKSSELANILNNGGKPKKKGKQASLAKLWDNSDKECLEVLQFVKTITPIDWKELAILDRLELMREATIAKQQDGRGKHPHHKGAYKHKKKIEK